MKVLLVQPPFIEEEITSLVKYAPMGLIALAAYIRQDNNIDVEIYDANVEEDLTTEKIVESILGHNPKVLGLTSMTTNINSALKIARMVKIAEPSITTVIGGIHATISPGEVLSHQTIDFVVMGEGEITFNDFLKNINDQSRYKDIDGLGYKENGQIVLNKRRELIKDLNPLPIPAYDLLKVEKYRSPYGSRTPFISVIRSRGCPYRCIFCGVQNMFGHTYRTQSSQRTMEEIDYLVNTFKIKEIGFKDSEFTLNARNVSKLCDLLKDRDYDLIWSCNARVDCADLILYKKMREAGCRTIAFGAESGDQDILNTLKKDITIQKIEQAVKDCQKAKIKVSVNFMIGNPGDTRDTIEKTIELSKKLNPDYAFFSFTTPFPGTELREMAIKNNWLINPDLSAVAYMELIMNATNLSTEELKKYMDKAYRSFYLRISYVLKRLRMFNKDEIKTSLLGLNAVIKALFLKRQRN